MRKDTSSTSTLLMALVFLWCLLLLCLPFFKQQDAAKRGVVLGPRVYLEYTFTPTPNGSPTLALTPTATPTGQYACRLPICLQSQAKTP